MRLNLMRIWVAELRVAVALPALGPLLDHHFAERQPGHLHVGPLYYHTHTYDSQHGHYHVTSRSMTGQPSALYNYESGPTAVVAVVITNMAMQSFECVEPSSVFLPPSPVQIPVKHNHTAPSEKPPRYFL